MKHNSIFKSLVLVRTNAKRTVMALSLGIATFSLAVGGMSIRNTLMFQKITSDGIVDISDPWATKDMMLMDYELLALEDQTHGGSAD